MTGFDVEKLKHLTLFKGGHAKPGDGLCLMEAIAYVAGEPHSDRPECVCPVIAAFGRKTNDLARDVDRQRLKEVAPLMVGTVGSQALQLRRALRFADWAVREAAPLALEMSDDHSRAAALRALGPIVDVMSANAAAKAAAHYATYAAYYDAAAASASAAKAANAARYAAYYAANAAAAKAANAARYAAYYAANAAASADAAAASAAADAAAHYAVNATDVGIPIGPVLSIIREVCAMKDEA